MKHKIFFYAIFPLIFPTIVLAGTVDLQFSTELQTIGPNQVAKITVKVSSPATETIYFLPTSSSATGQFTPFSTGRSGSYYISRGDSSKSFYYKDSSAGNFVIKVSPDTSRGSNFAPIEQTIIISASVTGGGETTGSGDSGSGTSDNSVGSEDDNSFESGGAALSVHTGETSLSNYKKEELKISAGRERLATVRTPITFSAAQSKNGKDSNYFIWSFGDGTSALGATAYHAYQFPGKYNVVLNCRVDGQEEAVARTTVLVTESNLKITDVDLSAGYVELTNNGDREQNLNNWSLRAGGKSYMFPLDTIISSHSPIKIPLQAIGLAGQGIRDIALVYPDGASASGASLQNELSATQITSLKKQLTKVKQQLAVKARDASSGEEGQKLLVTKTAQNKTKTSNVIVLAKESSWFEKIRHAIFE